MSDTDLELLARYTRGHAEDAFSEVVRRHLDLVHSAALRQVRSPQLAEEVAQSTFIKLASHAHRLAPGTILTAWLYQVARREAIDVVRREARRQLREQIGLEMNAMNATNDDWTQIEPLLDDAMHALDEIDRAAVLLRFFENKSLREVGQTLGTTDDNARKRVNRAVERLREFFSKRGVTVGTSGLAVIISANAVQAAPVGLIATISTAAVLGAAATFSTAITTKAIAMTVTKKFLITATLAAAVGTAVFHFRHASTRPREVQTLRATVAAEPILANETTQPSTPAPAERPVPDERSLQVRVVIKGTQDALPGANIRVSTSNRPVASPGDQLFVTGVDGLVNIPLPQNHPTHFVLQIDHDGFAGWWSVWDVARGEQIPAQHTVALERATLIGGIVLNQSGKPIPDASVLIGRVWRDGETMDRSNQRQEIRSLSVRTDMAGRWTHHQVPENLLENIQIGISHPDYAETGKMVDADVVPELRALNWVATLVQGATITGRVVDTNQSPVPGATVAYDVRFSTDRKETESDANGRYELKNLTLDPIARDNMVVVRANGFTPASQFLTNQTPEGELNFILQPGTVISGRVQNREGEPLSGVLVSREWSSIMDDDRVGWSGTTDQDGRFEWNGAQAKPQQYSFGKIGYRQIRNRSLAPGPTEHLIALDKSRLLKGSVRDATTKELIARFHVLPAQGTPQRLSSSSYSLEREFKDGLFEMSLDEVAHNVARVRAPGYLTAIFFIPAENTPLDVTLVPSETLEGLVVNSSGIPAARAEVAAIGADSRTYALLGKGRFTPGRSLGDLTATDENGRFKLDLSAEAQSVVAVHRDGGFAELKIEELRNQKVLRLLPWSRLEGTLLSNGKPLENQDLALRLLGPGRSGFNTDLSVFKTRTDAHGRFTFELVPSRELTLSRMIHIDDRRSRFSDNTNITVTPGSVTFFEYVVP